MVLHVTTIQKMPIFVPRIYVISNVIFIKIYKLNYITSFQFNLKNSFPIMEKHFFEEKTTQYPIYWSLYSKKLLCKGLKKKYWFFARKLRQSSIRFAHKYIYIYYCLRIKDFKTISLHKLTWNKKFDTKA